MIGQLVGERYRIRGKLGEGGMASVYTAVDLRLDRRIAIKIMHEKLAGDLELRQRFLLEAKTLSSFDHPNIIRIFDYSGDESPGLWIVTEILQGSNLSQFVAKFDGLRLHPILASFIIDEVASALAYAHSKGIFHRDVKPENIFALRDGRIKLMDFGIAKDSNRSNITMTGTFMGSPSYMSPEQVKGIKIDQRSDIYSLAVMFYEITTGKLPFPGANPSQVISKILNGKYIEPSAIAPWLPQALEHLIVTNINHNPAKRFQKVVDLQQRLRSYLAKCGCDQSSTELEAYFLDQKSYQTKLDSIIDIKAFQPNQRLNVLPISKTRHVSRGPNTQDGHPTIKDQLEAILPRSQTKWRIDGQVGLDQVTNETDINALIDQPVRLKALAAAFCIIFLLFASFSYLKISSTLEGLRLDALTEAKKFSEAKAYQRRQQYLLKNKSNLPKPTELGQITKIEKLELAISVSPNAQVYLDGKYLGRSDEISRKSTYVDKGKHMLRLVAEGYKSLDQEIEVGADKKSFEFKLVKLGVFRTVRIKVNRTPSRAVLIPEEGSSLNGREFNLDATDSAVRLKPGGYKVLIFYGEQRAERLLKVDNEGPEPIVKVDFDL